MDNEIVLEGTDKINLAQNRIRWQAVVSTVMNLIIPQQARSFLIADYLLASQ
jgi:hypothetical protein